VMGHAGYHSPKSANPLPFPKKQKSPISNRKRGFDAK
jgi:hypothetical protein